MANFDQIQQQSKQMQQWASCDPVTLVQAAKQSLYSQQQHPDLVGPLSEVIARFEQQTRASLGSITTPSTFTSGGGSYSA